MFQILKGSKGNVLGSVAIILCLLTLGIFAGCGSDSDFPVPVPKILPKIFKILVPDGVTTNPAVAVPSGISEDGAVVVGTIFAFLPAEVWVPASGFKWTLTGGLTLIDDVPGYEDFVTVANATNSDGSVIIGYVDDILNDQLVSWVWSDEKGYQIIPAPEGVTQCMVHDVTADGAIVLGSYLIEEEPDNEVRHLFIWSEEEGFVPLDVGYDGVQVLPVGIADDGLTIAYNCLSMDRDCNPEGTWTLQSQSRDWTSRDGKPYVKIAPPIELTENAFWASDLTTTEFGIYSSHSGDLLDMGGYILKDALEVSSLMHPALWMARQGQLNMLTGFGWLGCTTCVSPDGTWAGFTSHFMVGTAWPYVWSATYGIKDLYELMCHSDETLGSNLMVAFNEGENFIPTYLMGFSADNDKVVGVKFNDGGQGEMFGFMIENFDRLVQ